MKPGKKVGDFFCQAGNWIFCYSSHTHVRNLSRCGLFVTSCRRVGRSPGWAFTSWGRPFWPPSCRASPPQQTPPTAGTATWIASGGYTWAERIRLFKGTVSWDRFQNFWPKYKELGLTKGRDWCLNFLGAPMIL